MTSTQYRLRSEREYLWRPGCPNLSVVLRRRLDTAFTLGEVALGRRLWSLWAVACPGSGTWTCDVTRNASHRAHLVCPGRPCVCACSRVPRSPHQHPPDLLGTHICESHSKRRPHNTACRFARAGGALVKVSHLDALIRCSAWQSLYRRAALCPRQRLFTRLFVVTGSGPLSSKLKNFAAKLGKRAFKASILPHLCILYIYI